MLHFLKEADLDEPNPLVLIEDENGVSSTSTQQPLIVKMPLISEKSKGGKKRASHALKRATNEIRNLKKHNKNLKKSQNTLRKRLEREKKRNSEKKNTPRSKTDALIQRAGLTPGTRDTENIRKKLLYAECVSKEIRETSEENPTKRKLVGIVVSGKFMRKYKMLTELKKSTNITWRTQAKRSKKLNHERQPRNLFLRQKIASDVEEFLCRDDNSRCMPGKADAVKYGKVKKQKRILNDYLHNILIKFCAEHTYRISLATLARYRPKYISLVNYASRNTCLCQKHQDFALKLRCMKQMGVTTCTSPDQYVTMHRDNGIQEDLEKITLEKVNYKQWKKVKINDGKERMKIVDIELGKDDFKVEMVKQFEGFTCHVDRVKAQYTAVRDMKRQLPDNHALVQMDFAENYSCQTLEEIQSAYWNASMVTLHPTITYVRSTDGSIVHFSTVYVSSVLQHNASMVYAILKDLINHLKDDNPELTNIHFWTDSPTSQYRNKSIFDLISSCETKFSIKASWHYFECGHGKGPCDGIGGTTKRNADNAVKQGKATIQDGHDFMAWALSESASQISYRYISTEEFENSRKEIENRLKEIKPVKGTMKLHAVAAIADGRILTKETTCVCQQCFGDDGFKETTHCNWTVQSVLKNHDQLTPDVHQTEIGEVEIQNNVPTETEISLDDQIKIGSYVAAIYDNIVYMGKVLEIDAPEKEMNISFMGRGKLEGHYRWPSTEDTVWIDFTKILCRVNDPTPTGRSRRVFVFQIEDVAESERLFSEYLHS
ncbi:unnamed protein product [Mytilus coruscus]|uniref:Uncharacterized protein n=1 Tax=Mytilus coruscus TaxID=42192 RepID=A0A6J8CL08_MYTCO|nr:unnamed protein product [Mytilus coruscus]